MKRRRFVQSASGLLLLPPQTVFGSQANSALALGIIGCGGRGNYIGNFFLEHTGARIVALADPFKDRLAASQQKLRAPQARTYAGLNGYQDLLRSELDAVAIMSPPYYHPEQVAQAVTANHHIFLAKPVAVDVPGCTSIRESGRRAQGKLSFLVDYQTRVQPVFQEAAARVHRGEIGDPVLAHVYYHAGRIRPQDATGLSPAEARLRHWVFDQRLSGDIIVEQNVHVLDTAAWYLRSLPLKAHGTGGRKARTDVGDCWDHFLVTYDFPNNVKVDFSSAQFTRGYNDLCIRVYGSRGTLDSHYGGHVRITGDRPWNGTEKDDTFNGGALTNVKNFVQSIRENRPLNNVADSADSALVAVLGRQAAYRQATVTWDEMLRTNETIDAQLTL